MIVKKKNKLEFDFVEYFFYLMLLYHFNSLFKKYIMENNSIIVEERLTAT